jgi:hypothetical protein
MYENIMLVPISSRTCIAQVTDIVEHYTQVENNYANVWTSAGDRVSHYIEPNTTQSQLREKSKTEV